jgi:hypothetical protein
MVPPHEGDSFSLAGGVGEGCNPGSWVAKPSRCSGSWSVTASYIGLKVARVAAGPWFLTELPPDGMGVLRSFQGNA